MHSITELINNKPITDIEIKSITNNKTPQTPRAREAQATAEYIRDKLGSSDQSLPFYLKCAWRLPKARIDWMVGTAVEMGRNPGAYFNHLATKELQNKKAPAAET